MNKFITNYLAYTKNTETPELIHLWCALSCLAGAAERRVWLDRGMFKIYGNLFVILVGPPSVIAKSTSIGYMTRTLRRCNYNITEAIATKEKIVDEMASSVQLHSISEESKFPHTSITYALSELNALLTAGTDMILFLTKIFDEYESHIEKTIKRGTREIINPYFNLLGAATIEWFSKAICNDMLSTGFLSRCVIAYATKRRGRHSYANLGPKELDAQTKCLETLNWMKNTFGPIEIAQEAEEFYDHWYTNLTDDYEDDPKLGGFYDRKAKMFIPKLAMLLCLGDCRTTIKKSDFENAFKIFEYTEPSIKSCYAIAGANKLAPFARRILKMTLQKGNSLPYADMLQYFYYDLDEDEITKVIAILTGMNLIRLQGGCLIVKNKEAAKKFLAN